MKILVTGSSGFLGQNMVKYLRKKGHSVRTADIKKGKDLRKLSTCLKATKGIDWVIHLAADNGGYFYLKDNVKCSVNNFIIDAAMIQACIKNKVKHFFYASSSCVYPIRNPENSYGRFTMALCQGCGYYGTYPADTNLDTKVSLQEAYLYVESTLESLEQDVQVYPPTNSTFTIAEY